MGVEKKCARTGRTYKIYAPDISKNWFVGIHTPAGKRIKRLYQYQGISINTKLTSHERMAAAMAVIDALLVDDAPPVLSVKEIVDNWMQKQPWRPKTYRSYKSVLFTYLDWLDGKRPNPDNAERFMEHIKATRHNTTYNNYRRKLKRVLYCIPGFKGLLDDVKKISEHRRPARYFQRTQIELIKAEMASKWPDLLHFCELQYYCFIRPKEIRNLRAHHIILEERKILIEGTFSKNKDTEYVAIPDQLVCKLQYVQQMSPSDFLFPAKNKTGDPVGENTMWRRHDDLLKKLGFPKGYSLYSWKHTGAVAFIKGGGHPVQLKEQMRHKSLDQTMEYLRQLKLIDLKQILHQFPDM